MMMIDWLIDWLLDWLIDCEDDHEVEVTKKSMKVYLAKEACTANLTTFATRAYRINLKATIVRTNSTRHLRNLTLVLMCEVLPKDN